VFTIGYGVPEQQVSYYHLPVTSARHLAFTKNCNSALQATTTSSSAGADLTQIGNNLNDALAECSELFKDCKVKVMSPPSSTSRCGLVASQKIKKGESMLNIPFKSEENVILAPTTAAQIFDLPDDYTGWTGDTGLLALMLLHEFAVASGAFASPVKERSDATITLMKSWVASLPTLEEMKASQMHPFLWDEEWQETLQKSSTKKLYQTLDDIEEDYTWLEENIFSKNKQAYPQVLGNGIPCFNLEGFQWAMALVTSRAVYVNAMLQLVPVMDMANHSDNDTQEIQSGFFGTFGTTKGVQLKAAKDYNEGEEIFVSYGPKSAAEYVLEHGFIPPQCYRSVSVAELTFEMDEDDRFQEDKLDILEFETYQETGPMEPTQSFDIVSSAGSDATPDPAMFQFLRLIKLGSTDAFLLESIFRKEVWGFMSQPVSAQNELVVVEAVLKLCSAALEEIEAVSTSPENDEQISLLNRERDENDPVTPEVLCATVRAVEGKALRRMKEYMVADRDALDLKEYYQERRLKDLGLDSQWDPENSDVGWASTSRKPGGGELDW
jgi:[ribulose-bisphosphate carboxylase]-lysine N-methyltransferase